MNTDLKKSKTWFKKKKFKFMNDADILKNYGKCDKT